MATVPFNGYDQWRLAQLKGGADRVDMENDTLKFALVTSVYTPDQNLHDFWDDAVANEVSGSNYTARGNACANATVTVDGSGNIAVDGDDPATWAQHATGFSNARRAILYKDTGVNSTSRLIGYSDAFASDKGNVDGAFDVDINVAGLFTQAR